MSPRRAPSRAASTKPASKPASKPATRTPRSQPAKRAASPERSLSPPSKRKRTESIEPEQAPKPRSKSAPVKRQPSKTRATAGRKPQVNGLAPVREEVQQKPYFNPLPTPPAHTRPAAQLFVWGAGNFGQFGMGSDFLGEFGKPRRNLWIEEQMKKGTLGGEGAGLEAAAAGGLHTLLIDEKGTVSTQSNT
jgi:regulator of chromosome condensation